MCAGRITVLVLAGALVSGVATSWLPGAERAEPFVPPNYPLNIAPVDWPTNPGTRYEMPELVKRYPKDDIVLKVAVDGWTEPMCKAGDMGLYKVGDRPGFCIVIGDRNSRYFGSVKDGRDGGTLQCTLYWMDAAGKKVLRVDKQAVRYACATCGGYYAMYFNIPSYAKTGRHRLNISYVNKRLGLDLRKDLTFRVDNDGSWNDQSVLDEAAKTHKAVAVLQRGRPSKVLGIDAYGGAADTYLHATHSVPDRNTDFTNYGAVSQLRAGRYGQEHRSLLRFDLAAVPTTAKVGGAWLQLYLADWPGGVRGRKTSRSQFIAYEVLKDWAAGRGNGNYFWHDKKHPPVVAAEASWLCHSYPARWTRPGCDAPGSDRVAQPIGRSPVVREYGRWVTIPLDSAVVGRWIAQPRTNRGILLLGTEASGVFHAGEFEDIAMRPRLILAFSSGVADGQTCTRDTCGPLDEK